MRAIKSYCPDEALFQGLNLLHTEGIPQESRNGPVIVAPYPVLTINEAPMNRVIFSVQRDANPFFHLNEALWMLAGRNDITWLDQFVKDFSSRYGEEDWQGTIYQHGAYGFRWRKHFDGDGVGAPELPDQLKTVVRLLKADPDSRQAVLTMWDPVADLAQKKKDLPCNTHIYLRVRKQPGLSVGRELTEQEKKERWSPPMTFNSHVLDLTVCCRSNDAVWGAHGANVVHFSILQEYLAAKIGVGIGKLYQFSNNYHLYPATSPSVLDEEPNRYAGYDRVAVTPIVGESIEDFEYDLKQYMHEHWSMLIYRTYFFLNVAVPMRMAYREWRAGRRAEACRIIDSKTHWDWLVAAQEWFDRKMRKGKENVGS